MKSPTDPKSPPEEHSAGTALPRPDAHPRAPRPPVKGASEETKEPSGAFEFDVMFELGAPVQSRLADLALSGFDSSFEKLSSVGVKPPHGLSTEDLIALPNLRLFDGLDEAALETILEAAQLMRLEEGQPLFEATDEATSLLIVLSGDLLLRYPSSDSEQTLGVGDVLGEACLLRDGRFGVDAVAATAAELLAIPRANLETLSFAEEPGGSWLDRRGGLLLDLLVKRLVTHVLPLNGAFAMLDPVTREEFRSLFALLRAPAGATLIAEGTKADGIHLPLAGCLELHRGEERLGEVRLATMWGQASLIRRSPATESLVTTRESLLLHLPAARFNELAAIYPTVLMYLSDGSDSFAPRLVSPDDAASGAGA